MAAKQALVPASPGVARSSSGKARQLQHPALDEARKLAAAGRPKDAADRLEALAKELKPPQAAQVLAAASGFLRQVDRKRALELVARATELQPDLAQVWITLSVLRDEARDRKGSVAAAKRALELKCSPKELVDLGRHLSRIGQDRLAIDAARKGFADSGEAMELASFVLRVALQSADWALADRITARFRAEYDRGNYKGTQETPRTHLLWAEDDATNIGVVSAFAERLFAVQPPMVTQAWPQESPRKVRIGYISYDFRDHATALLALGALRYHDRDRFQIYGYCTSWDDNSALRREVLSRFDVARSFAQASDRRAAEQIKADRIDVLVDLNGLTEGTRNGILAWRPAPVQISYLGFPGTAGGRYIDYIVGDDLTVPKGVENLYPEKVIRIPPTYQINDYAARWLPPRPRKASVGLPEGATVIGMFNNVNKVGSGVWQVWMRILEKLPGAILWMLDPGEIARENLREAARKHGVDPDARIIFAPKMRQEPHIARLQLCDLVLDPWPYGGHTTTGDALFAGVPVVALEGTNFPSRVSGGLLRAAGLGMLVAANVDAYIGLAVDLVNHPEKILKIRRHLRQRRERLPVFDAATRTRQLEAAYLAAHSRSVRGLAPAHLRVAVNPAKPDEAQTPAPSQPAAKSKGSGG